MNNKVVKLNKKRNYEIDMCSGNLFKKIVIFCIPLMVMGVLQLLYNAADLVVVSNFSGDGDALGAVGSTSTLINLTVNLFMGLSVGTNVVCAKVYGAKDYQKMNKIVHTSVALSLLVGTIVGIFGIVFTKQLLHLMNNDLELSAVYLRIYFIGMPFNMLYNFTAAILRAVGDTKRPLYFLSIAGVLNVLLNLLFVIEFKMSVAGVAIATIISQLVSAVLIMITLMKTKECYHFSFKEMKISKKELLEITRIGLPAGLQASIFSLSNVIIQSSVNLFGNTAMNGNAAACNVEGFVYTIMNSVYHAALAFTGQNYGAKNTKNIKKVAIDCLIFVIIVGLFFGGLLFGFGKYVLRIYTNVESEIDVGYIRLHYLCLPYFLCGIMDVMMGILRGIGYSIMPMIVSLVGACGIRLLWIFTVFYPAIQSYENYDHLNLLYASYPISWIATFSTHIVCYFIVSRKVYRKLDEESNILGA